jgi:methyltransferase (TIGR00027 family)
MEIGVASMTARGVAAYRMSFDRVPSDYGRPADDQRLQEHVAAGVEPPPTNMTRYLRARTAFIDQAVVDAIAEGVGQIVSVGAGYDGRFLRYDRSDVRWIELDHPATQADKRARVEHLGLDTGRVRFAAADFTVDDIGEALAGAGHESGHPTLFTCEGVAGYLDVATIATLLRSLRDRSAPGSRAAIEIPLEVEHPEDVERRAALQATVGAVGEPLVGAVPRASLVDFLADTGWTVVDAVDARGVRLDDGARNTAFVSAIVG